MRLAIYRMFTLVAFTLSVCLWLDGMQARGVMCAPQAACAQVAKSAFGSIAGVPLSFFGMLGFGVIGLASLSLVPGIRRVGRCLSAGAALCAVGLIAIQFFVLSAICPWCLAIDLAAVVSGIVALDSRSEASVISRISRQSWIVAYEVALIIPMSWSLFAPVAGLPALADHRDPVTPTQVQQIWVDGKVNIVEVSSFHCGFCRELQPVLAAVTAEFDDAIHHERINFAPADSTEAQAYWCARQMQVDATLGQKLFETDDVSPDDLAAWATEAGADPEKFRACLAGDEVRVACAQNYAGLRDSIIGLPSVWIGDQLLLGLQPPEVYREAIQKELARQRAKFQ